MSFFKLFVSADFDNAIEQIDGKACAPYANIHCYHQLATVVCLLSIIIINNETDNVRIT